MIRILINVLDDEQIWRDLLAAQLEDYTVVAYSTSSEFFKSFSKDVDLVILDVRLNDGTDIIKRIQNIYDISPNCYLIVVSAYFDVPLLQDLLRMRVNDTVVKGANWLEELKIAVKSLEPKLLDRAKMKGVMNAR